MVNFMFLCLHFSRYLTESARLTCWIWRFPPIFSLRKISLQIIIVSALWSFSSIPGASGCSPTTTPVSLENFSISTMSETLSTGRPSLVKNLAPLASSSFQSLLSPLRSRFMAHDWIILTFESL